MESLELTRDTLALLDERAASLALGREETILRLLRSGVAVEPAKRAVPLHPDGEPFCKCDGPSIEYGPWHRKCHRMREAPREAGDFT